MQAGIQSQNVATQYQSRRTCKPLLVRMLLPNHSAYKQAPVPAKWNSIASSAVQETVSGSRYQSYTMAAKYRTSPVYVSCKKRLAAATQRHPCHLEKCFNGTPLAPSDCNYTQLVHYVLASRNCDCCCEATVTRIFTPSTIGESANCTCAMPFRPSYLPWNHPQTLCP
jgi:hypothetical protein